MTLVSVSAERCKTHLVCLQACPVNAIDIFDGVAVVRENCIGCEACIKACPERAIVRTAEDAANEAFAEVVAVVPAGAGARGALDLARRVAEGAGASVRRLPLDGGTVRDAAQQLAIDAADAALVVLPAVAPYDQLAGALAQRLGATVMSNVETVTRFPDGRFAVEIETHGGRGYATFDVLAGAKLVVTARSKRDALVVFGEDADLHAAGLELARALDAPSCAADALPNEAPRLLIIAGPSNGTQLAALATRAKGVVGFGIPLGHELAAACDVVFPNDAIEAMRAFAAVVP